MVLIIENIGQIVTGDIHNPINDSDAITIRDGRIAGFDAERDADATVIDANGTTVIPGLIDSQIHPVIGGYTPKQNCADWPENYLRGGVTTGVSYGELHAAGWPFGREGTKALAVLANRSYKNADVGMDIKAGTVTVNASLEEQDFHELAEKDIERAKFLGPVESIDTTNQYAGWAKDAGQLVIIHCGGASVDEGTGADLLTEVNPDVVAHINGGFAALPVDETKRVIDETDSYMDVIECGNRRRAVDVVEYLIERDELQRLILGTDTPTGFGVVPLGILSQICTLTAFTDLRPEQTICAATGNTGRAHRLESGTLEEGSPADLLIVDKSSGVQGDGALESIDAGNMIGISKVITDGEVAVDFEDKEEERMAPYPDRMATQVR